MSVEDLRDIVYEKFMDKVKDRCKIENGEYFEIIKDIAKDLDIPVFDVNVIIWKRGWEFKIEVKNNVYNSFRIKI